MLDFIIIDLPLRPSRSFVGVLLRELSAIFVAVVVVVAAVVLVVWAGL